MPRLTRFIAAGYCAALHGGAACSSSPTDPFYAASAPVPSGLPASSRALTSADSALGGRSAVTAAGDSVAVVATGVGRSCGGERASAGLAGGVVVVTRVLDNPPPETYCILSAPGPTAFKIVARGVPSGRYTVVLRERMPPQTDGSAQERELARGAVTLR